jgi:hypothetical protein
MPRGCDECQDMGDEREPGRGRTRLRLAIDPSPSGLPRPSRHCGRRSSSRRSLAKGAGTQTNHWRRRARIHAETLDQGEEAFLSVEQDAPDPVCGVLAVRGPDDADSSARSGSAGRRPSIVVAAFAGDDAPGGAFMRAISLPWSFPSPLPFQRRRMAAEWAFTHWTDRTMCGRASRRVAGWEVRVL